MTRVVRWAIALSLWCVVCAMPVAAHHAPGACHGRVFTPADVARDCFFPLTVGGHTVVHSYGHLPDTPNPSRPVCHCGTHPLTGWGASVGYWAPVLVVEVTRHPYCLVSMGGATAPIGPHRPMGGGMNDGRGHSHSVWEAHAFALPWQGAPGMALQGSCRQVPTFRAYMSELDPLWHNATLSWRTIPSALTQRMTSVAGAALCALDCAQATRGLPSDAYGWCAGCQGNLYPLTGAVAGHVNTLQASVLIAERVVHLLERRHGLTRSTRDDVCHRHGHVVLAKSHYRYQPLFPKNVRHCFAFGHATARWASGVLTPNDTGDYAYVVWQKQVCCAY